MKLIIPFLIISILLLAGCAEKECKTRSDCTAKGKCFIANCVKNTCDYRLMASCTCGDDECDKAIEDECTCEEDCGECKGKAGDFMEKECVENKCITKIIGKKETSAEDMIKYEESRQIKLQLSLKAGFDDPFNIRQSLMKVNIKIDKIIPGVTDIKITKIKIIEHTGTKDRYGKWVDDQPVTLAERDYTKILFNKASEFEKEFPVFIEDLEPGKSDKKTITLEVNYELNLPDRYGNIVSRQTNFEKEIEITFVNPVTSVSCPDSCNDKNPCTRDYCDKTTNNICEHEIITGKVCCGDDVCSPIEDKCKCPGDCGQCTGDIEDYMMMGCNTENKCTYQIKDKSLIQPTSKLKDIDFSGAGMSLKTDYDIPFDKSSSVFTFTFEPKVFTNVRSLVLKKITLLDKSGTILGEQAINRAIIEGSSTIASGTLTYTTLNAEEKKTVSARFDYSLEKQDIRTEEWSTQISSYSYSLGELTILNPS